MIRSRRTENYILGNLSSPRQWRNMYVFGASITTILKMILIILGVYNGLTISVNPTVIEGAIVEIVNTFIPLIAVFIQHPINAIVTFLSNMFLGLMIAAFKYELATGGGYS